MIYSPSAYFVCFSLLASSLGASSNQQQSGGASDLRASVTPAVVRTNITPELRGDIFMARKMYREAIDMYRTISPDTPIIENKVGIAYHQLLALDLAKKSYERAVKLNPGYADAINNLGTIYYAQKSYRRSISYYKKALRYQPVTASVYANLGAAYFARKSYEKATEYYAEAVKLDPGVFDHHSGFGTVMQERTIEDRAIFHLYLARMYAKSGSDERAMIFLRKALEEGIKERDKIPNMPEFSLLKKTPDFVQLLAENPKPL